MTFEVTGDAWTFTRATYGWIDVFRNGIAHGTLAPRGIRGHQDGPRAYHWVFRRSTDAPVEIAGKTLADAKRWIKNRGRT